MTMVVSGSGQSPENWSNSSIKASSSVTLPIGYWIDGSFSPAIMVSITWFTDGSVEIGFSSWLSDLWKLYLSYFAKRAFNCINTYKHIFTWPNWLGNLEWKHSHWKHLVVAFIVVKFVCVVVSFVGLFCWCFGLEFAVCTVTLEVGSSALVAGACLPHGFDLSDTWYIWSNEFSSDIALSTFLQSANITNIPKALSHYSPLCALVSHDNVF